MLGGLPLWERLRQWVQFRWALRGVNASVVGVLLAAFYDPVLLKGVQSWVHGALAIAAFVALKYFKMPPWALVAGCAVLGGLIL